MRNNNQLGLLVLLTVSLAVSVPFASGQNINSPVPLVNDPLVPTTVTPGGPAFTLTANGTGFVQGSVVNWDGSPRTTTYVSGTQLTATILSSDIASSGTASVTVANPSSSAVSNTIFLTITNPTVSTSLMPPNWVGSYSAIAMVVADFNGDGKLDSAGITAGILSVILGNGDGTFQGPVTYTTSEGGGNVALVVGDFNGDGKVDIALLLGGGGCTANSQGNVAIFLGNGDGTFQQPLLSPTNYAPISFVAADLNGDGKLDIAVTGYANCSGGGTGTAAVAVLLGNGDGTFQPYVELPPAYGPIGGLLVAGDFNGDGFLDLFAQSATTPTALTLLGNGDGTFQSPQPASIGYQPVAFATADINGDGKLDLIAPNLCGNVSGCDNSQNVPSSVSVLLGNGNGTFQQNVEYTVGIFPIGVGIGDFNGDGKLDLAVGTQCGSDPRCEDMGIDGLSVLVGNGDGTFQPQIMPAIPGQLGAIDSMTVGDFNNDGLLDLLAARDVSVNLQSTLLLPATSVTFGRQTVGTSSAPQPSTLNNISTKVPITVSTAQVTGANASDFSVKTTCSKLQPKSTCKVNVTFTPTASGTRTATVLVTDSAVGSPHQIMVTGTGAAPAASLSATALAFGTQVVNTASPIHFVTLSNTGNGALDISGMAVTGDFTQTSNCSQKLNPGASCKISIAFRPGAAGSRGGTLTITDNAPGSSQTVSLSGYGTFFKLSAAALSFGSQAVGTTGAPQSVTLSNVAASMAESVSVKMTGNNPGNFKQSNNCGTAVAAHSTCSITVTFAPTATGSRTAMLEILGGGGPPRAVTLTGNGN
jgi:hypothetical protein